MSEDDIALAGEYVLGLLDPAESAAAQARAATDLAFAAEVDAWRERLRSMVAGAETPAPDHIWRKIEAGLPATTGQDVGLGSRGGNVRLWQALTAASLALAAWMGFQSLQTPVIVPMENKPPMIAALGSETGNAAITARYDMGTGELLLTPVSLDTGKLYPELWIIPADGTPRSLGMMNASGATQLIVRADLREFMAEDAVLAITPEPQTGGPGGKPTGAVLASGKMTTI